MISFRTGANYSLEEIWSELKQRKEFPEEGGWITEYFSARKKLLIFVKLGSPSDYSPINYDPYTAMMEWFGKTNAHSAQPIFRELFAGRLLPHIFVQWGLMEAGFEYFGIPTISSYEDFFELPNGLKTIKVRFKFGTSTAELASPPPEGLPSHLLEGGKIAVQVNRYERDPKLRQECIRVFGAVCQICEFDFKAVYGELGRDFCHVHHLRPLAEVNAIHQVDPIHDLIPVCPNCHSMLHARIPALTPKELKEIILQTK
jgi:5-methylcytosine-specific restriction enzyme A